VALDIGWSAGSPFQTELAFTQLGFGIMALMCIWKRDSIWIGLIYAKALFLFGAAGVHIWDIIVNHNLSYAKALFLFGAAGVHIWDIIVNHNLSHGNTGTILFVNDLLLPLMAIILLHIYLKYRKVN